MQMPLIKMIINTVNLQTPSKEIYLAHNIKYYPFTLSSKIVKIFFEEFWQLRITCSKPALFFELRNLCEK